ncbi:MAG: DUF454 domain-containing protein [Methanobacterium sp.]|nr:DUF454 domain-containing protein [Methanobacterium sp.]
MNLRRIIFFSLGVTLLVVGTVGIVTPVLPTTPLVLAAFFCFTQSSEKAEKWISNNRYFGSYIDNYRTKKGVPNDVKLKSIMFLWVTLLVSMFLIKQNIMILIMSMVGITVTAHILLIKTR